MYSTKIFFNQLVVRCKESNVFTNSIIQIIEYIFQLFLLIYLIKMTEIEKVQKWNNQKILLI